MLSWLLISRNREVFLNVSVSAVQCLGLVKSRTFKKMKVLRVQCLGLGL